MKTLEVTTKYAKFKKTAKEQTIMLNKNTKIVFYTGQRSVFDGIVDKWVGIYTKTTILSKDYWYYQDGIFLNPFTTKRKYLKRKELIEKIKKEFDKYL